MVAVTQYPEAVVRSTCNPLKESLDREVGRRLSEFNSERLKRRRKNDFERLDAKETLALHLEDKGQHGEAIAMLREVPAPAWRLSVWRSEFNPTDFPPT